MYQEKICCKKLRPRDKSYRVSLERKERGLCCVSESARGSEACARQRYIRGGIIHSSTRNAVSGGPAALYILLQTSFAGSRQHASIHASPGPPWPLIIGRHQPEDTPAPTRTGSTLETRAGATRAVPDDRASSRPIIAWRSLVSSRFCDFLFPRRT